nr:hypothetical protein [Rhizobium sp. TH2]
MFVRSARVVAQFYGQGDRTNRRPVSANPEGAGHLSARAEAIGSGVHRGMPFANRLCPDENLLRQNASI